jgi:hypothetical protein
MRLAAATATATALIGSVVLANVLTTHYGLVSAGFGLLVSAGTYAAGLSLGLRDALHELAGVRVVLLAIGAGALLSWALADGRIALASGIAFGVAELADLLVYRRLRERGWRPALVASNAVGAVLDTVLFLSISGLGLTAQAAGGQLLVKAVWMTLVALAFGSLARAILIRRQAAA